MKISDFRAYKAALKKISMVTCYDYTSAMILNSSQIDCVLVGDSAAMTMHGHDSTLPISVEQMSQHTAAVKRGAPSKFIVGDLPFLSYRKSLSENVEAAGEIMRAGAQSVKLEGARGNLELIRHLVNSGIPVMGHLGLTPQSIHQIGGFKVQGKLPPDAEVILDDSLALQKAGCFALVLECVPQALAQKISEALEIPTIGIGAGVGCDGQVLVWQDLLGMNPNFKPKFLRKYADLHQVIQAALNAYDQDVKGLKFPSKEESY
ncbi:MAG: 3-methyl-2-oxobutanoate hydroxymethyltransferase [Proteobacteria bacterium]|jgi:3-methyl-2-oxobutanoate hydroxymethyltransferase|nr:3-methyl-2-oxobutanoate hydroxymethyltransferase [Pseudomonadota bacterium]